MRTCKGCGASFIKGETLCPYCGTPLVEGAVPPGADTAREGRRREEWDFSAFQDAFRPRRSSGQTGEPPPLNIFQSERRRNLITGILAIVFGTFGLHWFYQGRRNRALTYLLFFWTGVPTVLGIIEGIGFLRRSGLPLLPD